MVVFRRVENSYRTEQNIEIFIVKVGFCKIAVLAVNFMVSY